MNSKHASRYLRRGATIVATLVVAVPALAGAGGVDPVPTRDRSESLGFTGAPYDIRIPAGVDTIAVDACGAQGGKYEVSDDIDFAVDIAEPGLGGAASSTLTVTPGETLRVRVGGHGAAVDGGYNGGGGVVDDPFFSAYAGGGGATDVRQGGDELADRVLVAGGGGGSGGGVPSIAGFPTETLVGGDGGGATGAPGATLAGGSGGTQTLGGSGGFGALQIGLRGGLGAGGSAPSGGGGGGGGLYGGGGGGLSLGYGGGGGGGSSLGDTTEAGVCEGDGSATVSWTEPLAIRPLGAVTDEPVAPTTVWARADLSFAVEAPTSVQWRTVDLPDAPGHASAGSDYTAASGVLEFAPGEPSAFLPIEILPDELDEPDLLWGEWGIIEFHGPAGAILDDTAFFGAALFVIVDDD